MKSLTLSHSQRRMLTALISGQSMYGHAVERGLNDGTVQADVQRARHANGNLTTYQLVARLAVEMVRAERGGE